MTLCLHAVECTQVSESRALQNFRYFWDGRVRSVARVGLIASNSNRRQSKICCDVNWGVEECTFFFYFGIPVLSCGFVPSLSCGNQVKKKSNILLHSDFILIQLLYRVQSWRISGIVTSITITFFVGFILRSPILYVESPLCCQSDIKISWCKPSFSKIISLCSVKESLALMNPSACVLSFSFACTFILLDFFLCSTIKNKKIVYMSCKKMCRSKQRFTIFHVFLIIKQLEMHN